jgi:hypothetical protein
MSAEDSRIMPMAGGGFEQCYNAQAAVAAGSLLVVAIDVVLAPNDKQNYPRRINLPLELKSLHKVQCNRYRPATRHRSYKKSFKQH